MNKIMQKVKNFSPNEVILKSTVGTALIMAAANASADGELEQIGTKVASAISAFIGVVTAIGMAAITVIVAIQGFKLAWGMIKTIK